MKTNTRLIALVVLRGLTKASKKIMEIDIERNVPQFGKTTVLKWYKKRLLNQPIKYGKLYLFIDEYINFYDADIGIDAIELLTKMGYRVNIVNHNESGRNLISKGLLDHAKTKANNNVNLFKSLITKETPLVGIEPSAILTFRDEYLRLADDKASAKKIALNTFTIEEFFKRESERGNISDKSFTTKKHVLKIHGHCQQKAVSGTKPTFQMLSMPKNYKARIINSGCCGMVGSFGYEKEHYDFSMKVGEDTLFPKIRNLDKDIAIVASGISCRHQIKDGTNRNSKHPVTILKEAFIED